MSWIRTLPAGRAHNHPEPISGAPYSSVELMPNNALVMVLDQRKLPSQERYEYLKEWSQVEEAIRTMMVRGAPAIGIAAAYGLVLAAARGPDAMRAAADALGKARPTAVNLAHGIAAMMRAAEQEKDPMKLAQVARAYHKADVDACKRIGAVGAAELPQTCTVLTHCNAGALATGGYGTALGVVRAAREAGKAVSVVACETRPLLQGARLTAWELARDHIPTTLITDSTAASLMATGEINAVVVGADRIARKGDVANKIGTYALASLAHAHGVPFYVSAPWSSVDLACESGAAIPIEQRSEEEVVLLPGSETRVAPPGVSVRNPAFDVTPAKLITAIFTERGKALPSEIGKA